VVDVLSTRLLVQPFSEVPNRLRLCTFLAGTLSPASLQSLWTHACCSLSPAFSAQHSPHPTITVARGFSLCGESDHPLY
jgi:hypothetical protein